MVAYGTTVRVHYVGTCADGTVFDSTEGLEPLEFTVGSGKVIHGFDEAVASMKVGETKSVTVPACNAFGVWCEDKVECAPLYALPNAKDVRVGKLFYFVTEVGIRIPAKVLDIEAGVARIDFNHPLAGQDLTYQIELLDELG
ncbi:MULTISPECIES: FKBP-type peptidyl-prolyl cis-trans isomerase [Gordonibacter]|uniref:Peptidyl-prolyl cis-trans isomerase n=1 Tax=Gordonibacter faecis TaxID=3047475 RepID=A0ABT7DM73_9ACTN|nr:MULTISPECIES: FKBP-type peptidyl-prolyl cis-trans isomerase [unclassified Gordonibacter]MDJ1650637.1 FKBP-type peptidyl-prolyl cis-trans isomerase [Gordonibacter sp. KGMB12511]HIW75805.1 FKBP-type peptidyl-prolyl cis-trans isomerase [Candidatus Gordonibacter avicola]